MYFHKDFEKTKPSEDWDVPGCKKLEKPASIIDVKSIAYIIWEYQEPEKQIGFLHDFGLNEIYREDNTLYFKGQGSHLYSCVARRGKQNRYLGHAYYAKSRDDLYKLAEHTQNKVEKITTFGGGERVVLTDPAGWIIEVVYGIESAKPLSQPSAVVQLNTPFSHNRINQPIRTHFKPSTISRLGHVVLQVTNFDEYVNWLMRHLGHIASDVQVLKNGEPVLAFFRLNRGKKPADHHTLVIAGGIHNSYEHSAFETVNADDMGQGSNYLSEKGHRHFWGIGRHLIGSQMFDYWLDPHGFEFEHYCDGDVFNSDHPTQYVAFTRGSLWLWGDDLPAEPLSKKLRMFLILLKQLVRGRVTLSQAKLLLESQSIRPRPWLK